jgi:hypothetical protein
LTKNLQAFWACFAQTQVLEEVVFLENSSLPILEVNAGYPSSVLDIAKLEQEFMAHGKSGVLILPDDAKLELAASNAQFLPYSSLVLLEMQSETNDLIVEQVSWTQALTLAKVWCVQHSALDWQDFVAKEITRAMRQNPNLMAYLAFENHEPKGMMIVLEPGFAGWIAGETKALQALSKRLMSDFGRAIVAMQPDIFLRVSVLERYSVWVKMR